MSTSTKPKGLDDNATITDIREDISVLRKDFSNFFSTIGDVAKSKSSNGLDVAKDAAEKAKDNAIDAKTFVESKVRKHPLTTIGVAVGAGALIAMMRRK